MKVLIVKTSSMGDVIHTLPALSDAARARPGIRFDWVVEELLASIPRWHASVDRVIPVALRRWRRHPLQALRSGEWWQFRRQITATRYDLVIDAQGLLKSVFLVRLARGPRAGPNRHSARESLAALAYHRSLHVIREQHSITRARKLFAQALDYPLKDSAPDYGLQFQGLSAPATANPAAAPYIIFLHGTTWPSKQWPEASWIALGHLANQAGYDVLLPWHGGAEKARARRIGAALTRARLLPELNVSEMAAILAQAAAAVGVDTGLSLLAAALGIPSVTLYGATHPDLTGAHGPNHLNLEATFACSPCLRRKCLYRGPEQPRPACYTSLPAIGIWRALQSRLHETSHRNNPRTLPPGEPTPAGDIHP